MFWDFLLPDDEYFSAILESVKADEWKWENKEKKYVGLYSHSKSDICFTLQEASHNGELYSAMIYRLKTTESNPEVIHQLTKREIKQLKKVLKSLEINKLLDARLK